MFFFHENLHRDITLETFAKNLHHFMSPRGNIAMMKISLEKFRKKKNNNKNYHECQIFTLSSVLYCSLHILMLSVSECIEFR